MLPGQAGGRGVLCQVPESNMGREERGWERGQAWEGLIDSDCCWAVSLPAVLLGLGLVAALCPLPGSGCWGATILAFPLDLYPGLVRPSLYPSCTSGHGSGTDSMWILWIHNSQACVTSTCPSAAGCMRPMTHCRIVPSPSSRGQW